MATKTSTPKAGARPPTKPVSTAFPTVTPKPFTSSEQSAWAQLTQTLQNYGFTGNDLKNLVSWAKTELINGKDSNQISLDMQLTPEFNRRFPAIAERRKAGLPPISPADYVTAENNYEQAEQSVGLPPRMASWDALIANDVSVAEYTARINNGYLAVAQADPEVIKAFKDYYNVTPGQMAAYFLDPKKMEPVLLQQAAAAQIGGASATSGFGEINSADAMMLSKMGVNYSQAQQGFQKLATESQLYRGLPGQAEPSLSESELLQGQFGSNAEAQQTLARQAAYEAGTTRQGGGVGTTSTGATGLGALQR